jgi:hypothetical protein
MAGGNYHGYNRPVHRALALLLVLAALPAAAAQFRSVTVEEAARSSEAVVRGRVERRASRYADGGVRIVTDVEISVTGAWKGSPGARVVVTVPGGEVGEVGMWVDAAPVLVEGEEVVLFLVRRGAEWVVNGHALGTFHVEAAEARPQVPPEELVPAPIRAGELAIQPLTVAELERRVRAAR